MELKTCLNALHRQAGARMVPFGGWDMPLHYGSQVAEHHAVRRDAGVFDVSHMCAVDVTGASAGAFLRHLLANDVARLAAPGKALYSCMLRPDGGVLDDLICYFFAPDRFRLVVNAATADKDLAWIASQADPFAVGIRPRRDLAMLAIQGPNARAKAQPLLPAALGGVMELKPFFALAEGDWQVARTGYTGEDGFEVSLPVAEAPGLWQALLAAGVQPCGLGARDTLRLEAGMNLYGNDMDESVSPLAAGLQWTVALDDPQRDFIGRAALERQIAAGNLPRFVGVVLEGRGVLRSGQDVFEDGRAVGTITSGGFGPTLERSIGLARLIGDAGTALEAEIRGRRLPLLEVKPPFVRHGKIRISLQRG